ncbi:histidine phosphatase family protein [Desertibacillus haloalkaliphilus]|uniref:histidine phosphatase family protein n=1 Tax=Desertibacillus haloalkaliphilus TaxID=1328930 RepID=UPI001C27C299|nr:histidine phosphatase family protein [Desertibacillus haloalkaliphilus]MBU8908891.1 histidine phosphatase family protein [Desertibacillus haloalkaliphilus]
MKLYVIRHGESTANRLGKIQGGQDYPLSPLGKKQADLLGQYFQDIQLDYIYSSDLTRANETASAIGSYQHTSVQKWETIREVGLGPFEGKSREEIELAYPEVRERSMLTSGVEGTETIEQLTNRCQYLYDQLQRAHKNDDVALVSHGGFISIFLMYVMLGEEWHQYHRPFMIENTGITLIEWKEGRKPLIHYINRNPHLQATEGISKSS